MYLHYIESGAGTGLSGDRDRKFTEFEFTNPDPNPVSNLNEQTSGNLKLQETVITVNGLPGNVNLSQITKMFGEFGNITNITFSPYQMMGHSFMNAIVSVNLKGAQAQSQGQGQEQQLSFQSRSGTGSGSILPDERDIKDRSVDKEEMKTLRRNVNSMGQHHQRQQQNVGQRQGGIDPDILAKEIDELLADSDEDDDDDSSSEEEEQDSSSFSEEEDEEESSSDSDDDEDNK